ncbi:hypothetical protein BpHYR1_004795 [Brachionus plicatilis]|uniref:RNA-directed DNA polymerase from mobile element jockey-like n=1 Tax=Brachionus plicatilis TaxID=10195 RepID=A0A3M7PWG3_BRAPC|nr:hypothetical protein BpHYR1_004795 [Brachionus plicatilis]
MWKVIRWRFKAMIWHRHILQAKVLIDNATKEKVMKNRMQNEESYITSSEYMTTDLNNIPLIMGIRTFFTKIIFHIDKINIYKILATETETIN